VRRSILQDIPENKEVEISTPKTPRKTPKVKNTILVILVWYTPGKNIVTYYFQTHNQLMLILNF
jgi:hypothetical protein